MTHPNQAQTAQPTAQVTKTPRVDMYVSVHKAIRSFMNDTVERIGRLDVTDETQLELTMSQIEDLLTALESHLRKEDEFLHPAMEARQASSSSKTGSDHHEHIESFAMIREMAQLVRRAAAADRPAPALRLYRELAVFCADNARHMHVEETVNNPILQAHYTDAELQAIHQRLLRSLTHREITTMLRWMAPALTPHERAMVFGGMQKLIEPEAFRDILQTIRPKLGPDVWIQLSRTLNLPHEPDLDMMEFSG